MIDKIWKEVQAKLRLVHEDMNKLRTITTMVVEHISACLANIPNNMSYAVVPDEAHSYKQTLTRSRKGAKPYQTR